jgi:hypothetical protein
MDGLPDTQNNTKRDAIYVPCDEDKITELRLIPLDLSTDGLKPNDYFNQEFYSMQDFSIGKYNLIFFIQDNNKTKNKIASNIITKEITGNVIICAKKGDLIFNDFYSMLKLNAKTINNGPIKKAIILKQDGSLTSKNINTEDIQSLKSALNAIKINKTEINNHICNIIIYHKTISNKNDKKNKRGSAIIGSAVHGDILLYDDNYDLNPKDFDSIEWALLSNEKDIKKPFGDNFVEVPKETPQTTNIQEYIDLIKKEFPNIPLKNVTNEINFNNYSKMHKKYPTHALIFEKTIKTREIFMAKKIFASNILLSYNSQYIAFEKSNKINATMAINRLLNNNMNYNKCQICNNNDIMSKSTGCRKCGQTICYECLQQLMKGGYKVDGQSIFVICPYCRDEKGIELVITYKGKDVEDINHAEKMVIQ